MLLGGCDPPKPEVTFPHTKHVVGGRIACLYCHPFPEKSDVAGIPSVKKCMDCHSFLNVRTAAMQPLFDAWETQQPIRWVKHNDMPDHVGFSHQAHLKAKVICAECHGDVEHDQMGPALTMRRCVECHHQRNAQRNCSVCHK